jgi:hypothetical protein
MDHELVGKLRGHLHWAKGISQQKKDHFSEKEKHLRRRDYKRFLSVISTAQLPLFKHKLHHSVPVLEVLHSSRTHFEGFHAEGTLNTLAAHVQDLQRYHIALKDNLHRQAKLVGALEENGDAFLPITHSEVFPTLQHLLHLEREKTESAQLLAGKVNTQLKTFLHSLDSSHTRLRGVSRSTRFLRDHRPLYKNAYYLALSSLFFCYQHGLVDAETTSLLKSLEGRLEEETVPLPSGEHLSSSEISSYPSLQQKPL